MIVILVYFHQLAVEIVTQPYQPQHGSHQIYKQMVSMW